MTDLVAIRNIQSYTETLLAIRVFKSKHEKMLYQRKLSAIRAQLEGINRELKVLEAGASIYYIDDFKKLIQHVEIVRLVNEINARLIRLSSSIQ